MLNPASPTHACVVSPTHVNRRGYPIKNTTPTTELHESHHLKITLNFNQNSLA